jgi:hypothetical protein
MTSQFNEADHPRARGQFAVKGHAEATDVQLHAPADPTTKVSVPDPDDPFAMPIFEGPAAGAGKLLVPGSYTAYGLDDPDMAYLLTVPDPGSVDWALDPVAGTDGQTATVDGVVVTKAMWFGDGDPDDATAPRRVIIGGDDARPGQVYYDFDDAGWWAFGLNGTGDESVEDTEDGAVRALVNATRSRRR